MGTNGVRKERRAKEENKNLKSQKIHTCIRRGIVERYKKKKVWLWKVGGVIDSKRLQLSISSSLTESNFFSGCIAPPRPLHLNSVTWCIGAGSPEIHSRWWMTGLISTQPPFLLPPTRFPAERISSAYNASTLRPPHNGSSVTLADFNWNSSEGFS